MWKHNLQRHLLLVTGLLIAAASHVQAQDEAELLAVLRSDSSVQEKSAACRQLTRIATKQAVPTLASLLGDEKLSHMARYALEPIRDPSVDEALREALGRVQGLPRLGVIGSLGVRRDVKAIEPLAALLNDPAAGQAAARALGSIGTAEAAEALQHALPAATAGGQLAICEGLFRCAERLAADGQGKASQGIYDRLRSLADAPHQVRAAALRGAILSRGKDGVPLLIEALHGPDYTQAAAAVRAAMESDVAEIGDALQAALARVPAERRGLLLLALAERGDSRILPAVLEAAQSSDAQLRIIAFRALRRVGDASCVPALLAAAAGDNAEVSQAAIESLESLQDKSVDVQITEQLSAAQGKTRLVLLDLVARRRTVAATPALWQAADAPEASVRIAALRALGSVLDAAELPKLIARLSGTKDEAEAAALDKALCDVGVRSEDREAVAAQLAAAMSSAADPVKARILETLNIIGGETALKTTAAAARSDDEQLRHAASQVLGTWKSADAAPILLELYNAEQDSRFKIRFIRAYIRIARQFDMPDDRRAAMCRTALESAERDEDKSLVLEVLVRYPSEEMQAIAMKAADDPALKDRALLVVMAMANKGINRADLGRALARAGQKPVNLEILRAEYGAGDKIKDVTPILRKYAKNYRIIFLPKPSYNESLGGDPAPGIVKQLKINYRINGKAGEVTLGENATIILPMPR